MAASKTKNGAVAILSVQTLMMRYGFPHTAARGVQKLIEAAKARKRVEAIKRVTDVTAPNGIIPDSCCLQWHRNCYSGLIHQKH